MLIEGLLGRNRKPKTVKEMTVDTFDEKVFKEEEEKEEKKNKTNSDLVNKIQNSTITIHNPEDLSEEEKLMY